MSAPQQVPLETATRPVGPPPGSDEVGGWHKYMEAHPNANARALMEKYQFFYEAMKTAGWPKRLEGILMKSNVNWLPGLELDDCICIGIGSLARDLVPIEEYPVEEYFDNAENMFKYRPPAVVHGARRDISMYRLIFLMMLLTLLRGKYTGLRALIYDQPFFGQADKEFLENLGFTFLHASVTATAELVTPNTLYYAPDASTNVIKTVLERCHPGLYIGPPLRDVLRALYDPTGQDPTRALLESYTKVTYFNCKPPFMYATEQGTKELEHEIRWFRPQEQRKAWDEFNRKLALPTNSRTGEKFRDDKRPSIEVARDPFQWKSP